MSIAASPPECSPKRAAVLSAAARLFLAGGYATVSMDAVAKEAGVSKATLYAHFTGKEALFGAIVGERCQAIGAQAEELVAGAGSTDAALREMGRLWMRFLLKPESMAIHRIVIAEAGRFPDLAKAFYEAGPGAGRAWLSRHMAQQQAKGRLRAGVDPGVAADHMMGLLRGDLFMRTVLGGPTPEEEAQNEVVDLAVDAFLRAYGASAPSAP